MSLQEIFEELPRLTSEERRVIVACALELNNEQDGGGAQSSTNGNGEYADLASDLERMAADPEIQRLLSSSDDEYADYFPAPARVREE